MAETVQILVVDRNSSSRLALRSALEEHGYVVHNLRTTGSILEVVRRLQAELIVLRAESTNSEIKSICRTIRLAVEVPLIVLSDRSSEAERIAVMDAGADDCISGPFAIAELRARIRAILRRVHVAAAKYEDLLCLDGLRINRVTRQVVSCGRPVHLTPTEFNLLLYLADNPNMPLPHARILQSVWGPEQGSQIEYLRVFINQLRKKIEPDPSHPRYLLTEPWIGYRFASPAPEHPK